MEERNLIQVTAKGVASLLGSLLKEDGLNLFRRTPQIVLAGDTGVTGHDYILSFEARLNADNDKGTFNCRVNQERYLVFRLPTKMQLSFTLVAAAIPPALHMRSYDRLCEFFFDHRSIDPFIPETYRQYAALYDKLAAAKAELKATSFGAAEQFKFQFDYSSLFHSGNPLREELTAKSRVVDFSNENSERSVP